MTTLDHATQQWHETNAAIGDATAYAKPDPYLLAALLDSRAGWWLELARLRDGEPYEPGITDIYAIACHYAAILDQDHAARIRFANRIPTLHPGSVLAHLNLEAASCQRCGRPWRTPNTVEEHNRQLADSCPECPALLFGISPSSTEQAATYPPGQPWRPTDSIGEGS